MDVTWPPTDMPWNVREMPCAIRTDMSSESVEDWGAGDRLGRIATGSCTPRKRVDVKQGLVRGAGSQSVLDVLKDATCHSERMNLP